jgi:nucleotide-binding universal stress UspA family protein
MPKRILCATDASKASRKAVTCAIDLAKSTGAKLTFVTVDLMPAERMRKTHFWDQRLVESGTAQMELALRGAARAAARRGLADVPCVTVAGHNAADAIIAYADEKGFDHIVVGSSVRSAIDRLLVGSVATAVVTRAHCPVTVAR